MMRLPGGEIWLNPLWHSLQIARADKGLENKNYAK